jgi:hypothetical protein
VPASIGLLLPKPVDHFVCNDGASAGEGTKAQKNVLSAKLFLGNILRSGQTAPCKLREDPAGGFVFPSRQFPGSLQNIVIDVERGSHASDAIASKFHGQSTKK